MNKQITIGGESMSFQDFADRFEQYLIVSGGYKSDPAFFAAKHLEHFLHTYTKKS